MDAKIIDRLFGDDILDIEEIEKMYPKRDLKEGAIVTRIAPSPTGFMHIGTLYTAMIDHRLSRQSDGVFFLRLEDTDKAREVEGADKLVVESLAYYGIAVDEGFVMEGDEVVEKGIYAPYRQSLRKNIYQAFVRQLVQRGLAYPCFCSSEELEEIRNQQTQAKVRPGYYGRRAKRRGASDEQILAELDKGTPFTIRFKSDGDESKRVTFHDMIKGDMSMPQNDVDVVIMKADGLPTYHFAHIVDDHFMWTNLVVRGDEWLPSAPLHLQLFEAMGWDAPAYCHLAPIQKMDGSSKRKLSKRKDPEANIQYYKQVGFPKEAVLEYLLNLANSDFYEWRKANPTENLEKFPITFERLANSNGPLLDFPKLINVSKEIISNYTAQHVYEQALAWAKEEDDELLDILSNNEEYCIKIFDIERGGEKPRKDIGKWSDVKGEISYFFEELHSFDMEALWEKMPGLTQEIFGDVIKSFMDGYNPNDDKEVWFEKMKKVCIEHGYCENVKEYKQNKEAYKGSIIDISNMIRFALTGRFMSPDIYAIMQVLGEQRLKQRMQNFYN